MQSTPRVVFVYFCALLLSASFSLRAAQSVTLAWDPNPEPDIAGYNLAYGVASGAYTNKLPVGNVTTSAVSGLLEGVTYFFVVTAYNTFGLESDPSNEVSYSVPTSIGTGPTLDPLGNLTINENSGVKTVSLSGITTGQSNSTQLLAVGAASSNPGLIPAPLINYSNPQLTGTLSFAPVQNGFGAAVITVTVSSGLANTRRSFMVTVNPVNNPPTLDAIADVTMNEDAVLQTIALTGISSGATNENQNITVSALSSNPALIPNPAVNYTSPAAAGTLAFAPRTNANGIATITVTVNDGGVSNNLVTKSFYVTVNPVNDAPTISSIANQTVFQAGTLGPLAFTVADVETPSASLTVAGSSSNPALIPSIEFGGGGSNRTVTLLAATNQAGTATITLVVSDGMASASNSFWVSINAAQPRITIQPQGQTVTNGGRVVLQVMAAGAPPLVYAWQFNAASLAGATNSMLTLSNAQLANAGSYQVLVSNSAGSAESVGAILSVTTGVAGSGAISSIADQVINEDSSITIPFTTSLLETTPFSLKFTAAVTNRLLVDATKIFFGGSGANRTMTLSPNPDQFGTTLVTVTGENGASSASRTFLLTVNSVNDPPTLDPLADYRTVVGGAQQNIALTGISSGASNEAQLLVVTASASGLFTPAVSYTNGATSGVLRFQAGKVIGSNTVTVTVNDGGSSNNIITRSFAVFVRASGVAQPSLSAISNVTTAEDTPAGPIPFTIGHSLTPATNLSVRAQSSNLSLLPNSNIVFGGSGSNRTVTMTPALNQTGTSTIHLLVVGAGFNAANEEFLFTVTPRNDPPAISSIANQILDEDASSAPLSFTVTDFETSAGDLIVTAASSNPSLIPNTNLFLGGGGPNRLLILRPLPNQFGTATITVTVSDGAANQSTSFLLTVNPVNDPPTLDAIGNLTINQPAAPQTVDLTGISSGAANELETLTVTASSSNPALIANPAISYTTPNSSGRLSFIPASSTNGIGIITVIVTDGGATNNTLSRTFTVTLNAVSSQGVRPVSLLSEPASQVASNAGSVVFTVTASGLGLLKYQWQKDGVDISGAIQPVLTLTNLNQTDSGWYAVAVWNELGRSLSSPAQLRVIAPPRLLVSRPEVQGAVTVGFGRSDSGGLAQDEMRAVEVWTSTNLCRWELLPATLVLSNDTILFRDFAVTNRPRRFFRVIERP